MSAKLEQFTVAGLHGKKTIDAHLREDTLILVL